MNWLALILSLLPLQDDVPANRIVAIIIPQPASTSGPPNSGGQSACAAIAKRLDSMQAAWAERETVFSKLIEELETRQEQRDKERFEFVKEWLENLRPGPAGPVDVGPVRQFFDEWKAEREHAKAERAEAAAERAAWREDRERWRSDSLAAATERKTMLERLAESRTVIIEARTAAIAARAEAAQAAANARATLAQTGPFRDALRLMIWLVVSLIVLVLVLAGVYVFVLRK